MKTLIDLPGNLLAEARAEALHQQTTLDALMERALRQEMNQRKHRGVGSDTVVEENEHGFPVLKKRGSAVVTSEYVYRMLNEEEN